MSTRRTRFRPCIDLHDGKVKQIVGSTLTNSSVSENFVSEHPAEWFANFYRDNGLTGGHVIRLGPGNDQAASAALEAWPGGLQIGGGLNADNGREWLEKGASHLIFTSFLFPGPTYDFSPENLEKISDAFGKKHIVVDLSCKRKEGLGAPEWVVMSNRWKTETSMVLSEEAISPVKQLCSELLIHAVDVEGKQQGIDEALVQALPRFCDNFPVTYAGGTKAVSDLALVQQLSNGSVDLTFGSCLDIFGGTVPIKDLIMWNQAEAHDAPTHL